jgi:hypothetical protein
LADRIGTWTSPIFKNFPPADPELKRRRLFADMNENTNRELSVC